MAESTTNAFKNVLNELQTVVMCWFYMRKAYEDHNSYASIESIYQEKIKQDIYTWQLSESDEIFNAAYVLFKKKWLNKSKAVDTFLNDYFDQVWF